MIAVLLIKHENGEAEHLQICLDSLEQQTNKDFKVYETTPDSIDVAIQSILNDDLKQICYLDSFDFYLPEHIDIIQKAIARTNTRNIYTISKVVRFKNCGGPCCIEDESPKITEKMYDQRVVDIQGVIRSAICVNYDKEESNTVTQVNIITVTHRLKD
jgi:hypothetical protein